MIPTTCKRLIEVDFPIAVVSTHSAKEKSIRHGHPSTLHLWWARRPLAACRAVLLGLLLPDPCDSECPPDFKTKARELLSKRFTKSAKTDDALQQLLLEFIGEFANWDNAANAMYLEIGRGLVKAAHPEETPVVVDPFSGGGSIPLEALRLGCEAFASDLNPVACLILKTLLEDIPRYGNAEFRLADGKGKEIVIHGLADALRHVGKQVKDAAENELAQFYPLDPDGSRPIAYVWARTVRCEGIGCGAEIPLVRSFWLGRKASRKHALRFSIEREKGKPPRAVFEIFKPKTAQDVPDGTVSNANATCPCCSTVLPATRVQSQLLAQSGGIDVDFDKNGNRVGGATLLCVVTVAENEIGRRYRLPDACDYQPVWKAQQSAALFSEGLVPNEPLPSPRGNKNKPAAAYFKFTPAKLYGVQNWGGMFTARQKIVLVSLTSLVTRLPDRSENERVIRQCLSFVVSKLAERLNAHCDWMVDVECPGHLFTQHALPQKWNFAESSVVSGSSGSIGHTLEKTAQNITASIIQYAPPSHVELADACASPLPTSTGNVWFTDPPYYDAVPYSDLADFFFVWLKRILPQNPILRDPFDPENPLTPKAREIVDDMELLRGVPKEKASSLGIFVKDRRFFEREIARAFAEGRRVLRQDGIGCIVFAHKTTEGWEALLTGILSAKWIITASWPITTERYSRMRARNSAALAGSVHLVCRPRPTDAGIGDWSEVKAAMEKRIREWLPTLVKHGVRGADAIFSCLGPALESYSRYEKVLTAADREVPLGGDPDATEPEQRGFLAYVFETLSKEALRQVLGDAETEGFEEDARMTALFLWTLQSTKPVGNGDKKAEITDNNEDEPGDDEDEQKVKKAKAGFSMPFDTFIRLTRPMGIHYPALEGRIIDIEKGVVRLLPVRERSEQLLGEAAKRPGAVISLEDVQQMELGLVTKRQDEAALPSKPKRGQKVKAVPGQAQEEATFTALDRIHRAMLLFGLGRSTLLRQVLEKELRESKRFERLALSLNALYPDGSEERRMLEGVQAAMRGI
jgi:adenine-specific DNA methylase